MGIGMGMEWGGACVTVPRKENTRTSRHVKRYGDGDGDGDWLGRVMHRHVKRYGHWDGVGWGICFSDIKGQHKEKHTCVKGQADMWRDMGMGRGWVGVGYVLPFHGRRTEKLADTWRDRGMGRGWGWGLARPGDVQTCEKIWGWMTANNLHLLPIYAWSTFIFRSYIRSGSSIV